jgi:hypothetical protein
MLLVLSDLNPEVVFAWTQNFADYQNVSYRSASILRANIDLQICRRAQFIPAKKPAERYPACHPARHNRN